MDFIFYYLGRFWFLYFFNYLLDNFIISKMMPMTKWAFIGINYLFSLWSLLSSLSYMSDWRSSFRIPFGFVALCVWLQMLVCRRGSV